jgi:HlyD family secretion protein
MTAIVCVVLVGGIAVLAATIELSGAVIASGSLVVDSNVKKIQHPWGGIVAEVKVRDGDAVKAGDILLRLDRTIPQANLAAVTKGIIELRAREARLDAERDDAPAVEFAPELLNAMSKPDVAKVVRGEQKLYELRRIAREGQKSQLRERISQLENEIRGLLIQATTKEKEILLIRRELEAVRELWSKSLIGLNRLTALERESERLKGEQGQLMASTAQAQGKISEAQLQIIQIDQNLRSEVAKEVADIRAKLAELVEKQVTVEDQLRRVEIRSPQDGYVHQLAVHTVGGVVKDGEPLMLIVPHQDDLTLEARVAPQDIDQVKVGQSASLRFAAFNQRTTPEVDGVVAFVSPDAIQDQRTGGYYYMTRIAIPERERARLGEFKLLPGMPVEGFIATGERTMLSYLWRPLHDHFARSFRER